MPIDRDGLEAVGYWHQDVRRERLLGLGFGQHQAGQWRDFGDDSDCGPDRARPRPGGIQLVVQQGPKCGIGNNDTGEDGATLAIAVAQTR